MSRLRCRRRHDAIRIDDSAYYCCVFSDECRDTSAVWRASKEREEDMRARMPRVMLHECGASAHRDEEIHYIIHYAIIITYATLRAMARYVSACLLFDATLFYNVFYAFFMLFFRHAVYFAMPCHTFDAAD